MSKDYLKGKYDDLLERHKELQEMYRNLLWQFSTKRDAMVSGAQVAYYAGVKFDTTTIGLTIGGTGIVFTVFSYFLGLVAITFGVTLSSFGFLYGLISHLRKKPEEERQSTTPKIPPIPTP